jgi:hypothetical protein
VPSMRRCRCIKFAGTRADGQQTTRQDHGRWGGVGAAEGGRRRLYLRQFRHRLSADHRRARGSCRKTDPAAAGDRDSARKRGDGDGAWLLSCERPRASRDGAHQCRPRQLRDRRDQCGDRAHPGDPVFRPHADHRERPARQPHRANRLGPGNARPDRAGARVLQMGLRAALSRAGAGADRSRPRHRLIDAEGAGVSVAAARGFVRIVPGRCAGSRLHHAAGAGIGAGGAGASGRAR